MAARPWLLAAGWMSVAASLAHLACIIGGPEWFIFMGAPRRFAFEAGRGAIEPILITIALASIIFGWAAYAFSAADWWPRLPFRRLALALICLVLLARGMGYFIVPNANVWRPDLSDTFMVSSSVICIVMGTCFAIGTWRVWPQISGNLDPQAKLD